jgi:hypothetical protein
VLLEPPGNILQLHPAPSDFDAEVAGPVNSAETASALSTMTEQAPVPEHAPLQPVKVDPVAAVAVSVTLVPLA